MSMILKCDSFDHHIFITISIIFLKKNRHGEIKGFKLVKKLETNDI